MTEKTKTIRYKEYDGEGQLPDELRGLYRSAAGALATSYAPYSRFSVGAAVLCSDGTVYTGCNIENGSFGATICAERVALTKAISDGRRSFDAIAIAADNGDETDFDDFRRPERRTFNGWAQVIVRARPGAAGEVLVKASSAGLSTAVAAIKVVAE